MEEVQQKEQEAMQQQMQMEEMKQTPNLLKAPMLDPSKNPELLEGGGEVPPEMEGGPPLPPQ